MTIENNSNLDVEFEIDLRNNEKDYIEGLDDLEIIYNELDENLFHQIFTEEIEPTQEVGDILDDNES